MEVFESSNLTADRQASKWNGLSLSCWYSTESKEVEWLKSCSLASTGKKASGQFDCCNLARTGKYVSGMVPVILLVQVRNQLGRGMKKRWLDNFSISDLLIL